MTVIDWNAACPLADEYRALAHQIDANGMFAVPKPLEIKELESLLLEFGLLEAVAAKEHGTPSTV